MDGPSLRRVRPHSGGLRSDCDLAGPEARGQRLRLCWQLRNQGMLPRRLKRSRTPTHFKFLGFVILSETPHFFLARKASLRYHFNLSGVRLFMATQAMRTPAAAIQASRFSDRAARTPKCGTKRRLAHPRTAHFRSRFLASARQLACRLKSRRTLAHP